MNGKRKRDLVELIDSFFSACERIMLRTLIFACFAYEVGRFIHQLRK
jgi:LPS O-antigen subunit length determinant protein (WzzB/FepE family)